MSFVAPLLGPIIRAGVRQAYRYTIRAINLQDDALKAVLQTSPSRNMLGRAGIRGIRHGLAGGAIASPLIEQYKGISNVIQEKSRQTPNKLQKKYSSKYSNYRSRRYKYSSHCKCRRNYAGTRSSRSSSGRRYR